MARVALNRHQHNMRLHHGHSDEEECVHSGSATGFSDCDRDEYLPTRGVIKQVNNAFDPVTQILDKIDAELVSLTRSQGSSSTATTNTDNTVIKRPTSRNGRHENGEELSMSQLGSSSYKPSTSFQSSSSRNFGSSDRDTGIGTGPNSFHDNSVTSGNHRNMEADLQPLEPGDSYKMKSGGFGGGNGIVNHKRSATAPEMLYLNGQPLSDDDKSKREQQNGSPFEAKQVDDKFKEILQKRKGGYGGRVSGEDDNQTIRTEDFVDKFQDTMVYSSADEAERLRNLEDDLHSDDGRSSPRPVARPLVERPKRKLPVASSFDSACTRTLRKGAGPGYPPIYPKPTPTSSLPRPSARSSLKFSPGHASDADSVRTEDFENSFNDMMVAPGNQTESDLDPGNNTDPIHTKVKQLLKATAKYRFHPNSSSSTTNSILKSRLRSQADKPKVDQKSKPHVRISPQPPQYNQTKGEESDDTLCSDKEDRVLSPRRLSNQIEPGGSHGNFGLWNSFSEQYGPQWMSQVSDLYKRPISKSFNDDSLSKSSCSLSQSSLSSSDKDKSANKKHYNFENFNDIQQNLIGDKLLGNNAFSRQISQISTSSSLLSSNTGSDLPNTSTSGSSRCTSTGESMFDDADVSSTASGRLGSFREYQYTNNIGPTRRRSSLGENIYGQPYTPKKNDETMKNMKKERRPRDLIVADEEEEEEFPFSKHTFNKKKDKEKKTDDEGTTSLSSSLSQRSSSQDSIYSVGLMNQFMYLNKNKVRKKSSTSSLMSSFTDINQSTSVDDSNSSQNLDTDWQSRRQSQTMHQNSSQGYFMNNPMEMRQYPPNPYQYGMYNYPTVPLQTPSQANVFNKIGLNEAMSILPERFLKSWLEKALLTQQNEYLRHMMMPPIQPQMPPMSSYSNPYFVDDNDLPPSVSAQHSLSSTPMFGRSIDNIPAHVLPQGFSTLKKRRLLRRANTFSTSHGSTDISGYGRRPSTASMSNMEMNENQDFSNISALQLKKENSFDKLKRILQSTDTSQYRDRSAKRYTFASNHQKSLPIFLETLSEEEEERKRSRTPSFETDQINELRKPSKMRSFLEEEEQKLSATPSDHLSDSSLENFDHIPKPDISMKRHSFSFIESDESYSTSSSSSRNDVDTMSGVNRCKRLSIPSIIISQKLETDHRNQDVRITNTDVDKDEEKRIKKLSNSRPNSPNPDNQKEDETVMHSKDSLEIAEIMSSKDKESKQPFITTLSKIDSVSSSKEVKNLTPDWMNSRSNQYLGLNLSTSDMDHLSPSSSITSPIIMSPITVIEVTKLDNQGDCFDADDNKDGEAVKSSFSGAGNHREQGEALIPGIARTNLPGSGIDKNKHLSKKFKAPRCLQLKRHNDENTQQNCMSMSGSENVFTENTSSMESEKPDHTNAYIQADDNSLTPLIKISEISRLLNHLMIKMPQLTEENIFFLAQDKYVQCDLDDFPGVKPHSNVNAVDNRDKVIEKTDISVDLQNVTIEKRNTASLQNGIESCKTANWGDEKHAELKHVNQACQTEFIAEDLNIKMLKFFNEFMEHDQSVCTNCQPESFISEKYVEPHCFGTWAQPEGAWARPDGTWARPEVDQVTFKSEIVINMKKKQIKSETVGIDKSPTMIDKENFPGEKDANEEQFLEYNDYNRDGASNRKSLDENKTKHKRRCYSVSSGITDVDKKFGKDESIEDRKSQVLPNLNLVGPVINERRKARCSSDTLLLYKNECRLSARRVDYEFVHQSDLEKLLFSSEGNDDVFSEVPIVLSEEAEQTTNEETPELWDNMQEANNMKTAEQDNQITNNSEEEFAHFHSAFYINLNYGQTKLEHSEDVNNQNVDDLEEGIKHLDNDINAQCGNDNQLYFEIKEYLVFDEEEHKEFIDECSEPIKLEVCPASPTSQERLHGRMEHNMKLTVPKADSGFNESKSISDGDRSFNSDYEDANTSLRQNELVEDKYVSLLHFNFQKPLVNRVKVMRNENRHDRTCISNVKSTQRKTETEMDENVAEDLHFFHRLQDMSGESSEDNVFSNESMSSSGQNHLNDSIISTDKDDTENENNDNVDFKSLVISTRSLDFETEDSRRNILQRCQGSAFAKTLDIGELDYNYSFGVTENICGNEKHTEGVDLETYQTSILTDTSSTSSRNLLNQSGQCKGQASGSDLGEIDTDLDTDLDAELRKDIEQFVQVQDTISDHSVVDGVMYKLGMKHNDDTDFFDMYGRFKTLKDDGDDNFSVENNIDENSVADTIDPSLCDSMEKSSLKPDSTDDGNDDAFDMFKQVIDNSEEQAHGGKDTLNVRYGTETNDFNADNETQKAFDEIERLYSITNMHKRPDFLDEITNIDDRETDIEDYQNEKNDSNVEVTGNFLQDVDNEIAKLDAYYDRFVFTEIHICRNCLHSVSVPCTNKTTGTTIAHDYCRECSPMNLTADMLEQRRLEKMSVVKGSTSTT